jgi:hypothetical protein
MQYFYVFMQRDKQHQAFKLNISTLSFVLLLGAELY